MRFESESIDFSSFGIVVREQPQIWTHDLKKKLFKKTWPGRFRSNLPEHSIYLFKLLLPYIYMYILCRYG
jgi:hypothetical protein